LDVLSKEQFDDMNNHPLVAYACENDNLIITPHIGGCTAESMEKTEYFLARRLLSLLNTT
jgi:D-3-phosphoglycerate dehydrogenase